MFLVFDCHYNFARGKWRGMDSWEAVFEGKPMSFQMFEEKWPGLVSVDEFPRIPIRAPVHLLARLQPLCCHNNKSRRPPLFVI
jgi:hypothetical protein